MLEDKKPQLTPISELGEFGLIKHLTENFPIKNSSTELSIGDDAAIINPEGKKVVITSDVLAEGVHFNLGYVPLKHLGYKAVVANLSDPTALGPKIASAFMATLYVGMAVIVLVSHYDQIGAAFEQIFIGAFTGAGVAGGFIGALIQGLKRATFSNEAGVGSAAIAHSAVKTKEPITEGFVSLLEPFIDTVVICTMTALVIIISGMNTGALSGVTLTAAAFTETSFIFEYFLALAVVMFAFSTMVSWSYYGLKAWTYLFGEGATTELVYKGIFCLFVIVGTSISFGAVIDFSDAAMFSMSIFNIIGLYYLMPIVKKELNSFVARVNSGEIKRYK